MSPLPGSAGHRRAQKTTVPLTYDKLREGADYWIERSATRVPRGNLQMTIRCRLLGHRPAEALTVRDPFSFVPHSQCRRCRTPLIRDANRWQAANDAQ
jgi:hypothetical protein